MLIYPSFFAFSVNLHALRPLCLSCPPLAALPERSHPARSPMSTKKRSPHTTADIRVPLERGLLLSVRDHIDSRGAGVFVTPSVEAGTLYPPIDPLTVAQALKALDPFKYKRMKEDALRAGIIRAHDALKKNSPAHGGPNYNDFTLIAAYADKLLKAENAAASAPATPVAAGSTSASALSSPVAAGPAAKKPLVAATMAPGQGSTVVKRAVVAAFSGGSVFDDDDDEEEGDDANNVEDASSNDNASNENNNVTTGDAASKSDANAALRNMYNKAAVPYTDPARRAPAAAAAAAVAAGGGSNSAVRAATIAARAAEFYTLSDNDKARKVAQYVALIGRKKAAKLGLFGDGPGGYDISQPPASRAAAAAAASGNGGGSSAGGAGSGGATVAVNSSQPSLSFADVGGIESVLQDIRELIQCPLTHPEVYEHLGVEPPRGVLLHGPPGCGKTMLAHAIAGELKVPLLKISAPEIVSGMSGESEAKIRGLFAEAQAQAPCILFIDEIDAIAPKRADAQREMERRIVAQLLTSMDSLSMSYSGNNTTNNPSNGSNAANDSNGNEDSGEANGSNSSNNGVLNAINIGGISQGSKSQSAASAATAAAPGTESLSEFAMRANNSGAAMTNGALDEANAGNPGRSRAVIVIGATNRPDAIDSALRRAGRFDREIALGIPDDDARARILQVMCRNMRVDPECDFAGLTKKTVGYVGADLAALTREAAVIAVNRIFADVDLWESFDKQNATDAAENDDNFPLGDEDEAEAKGGVNMSDDDENKSSTSSKSNSNSSSSLRSSSSSSTGAVVTANALAQQRTTVAGDIVASRALTKQEIHDELLKVRTASSNRLRALAGRTLTPEQLEPLFITEADFFEAIKKVQPTAKREGFAMVPDVTWADVGALDDLQVC